MFFALVARAAIRIISKPPSTPEAIPKLDRVGAHWGHSALYETPFLVILMRWAEVYFGGTSGTVIRLERSKDLSFTEDFMEYRIGGYFGNDSPVVDLHQIRCSVGASTYGFQTSMVQLIQHFESNDLQQPQQFLVSLWCGHWISGKGFFYW